MWRICWSWQAWLDVVAFLRASDIDYCHPHAELIQQHLDATPADVTAPCISLPDDVVLRSVNLARWRLGLPLPDRAIQGDATTKTPPSIARHRRQFARTRAADQPAGPFLAGDVVCRIGHLLRDIPLIRIIGRCNARRARKRDGDRMVAVPGSLDRRLG